MKIIPVKSSFIDSLKYCPETGNLAVRFKSGRRYIYFEVPPSVVDCLATSTGSYFNSVIRSHYEYEQIA